jgi:4,5:9,10-diseco-3-hydroxy-5,9,17-trioxoandrosta-1(10),2-diene-4-oate hydrolase
VASLVGNSAGGLLSANFALAYPDRVNRLALVDAAGLGRELAPFLRLASVPLLGELLETPNVRNTRALMKSIFYTPRPLTDGLAQELMRVRNLPGAKRAVLRAIRRGVNLLGLRRELVVLHNLGRIRVPLLIVWGREDRVIPVAHALRAAREVPNCKVYIFPRCGHWPQMERAKEFNRLLLQFLEGRLDNHP